jgi:hypothetical protein
MSNYVDDFGTNTLPGERSNRTDDGQGMEQYATAADLFKDCVVRVHSTDMESETLKFCIEQSLNGVSIAISVDLAANGPQQDKNSLISKTVKKELDRVLRPTWHVVAGDHYGSFVTHEKGCFLCMTIRDIWITIFRSA